MKVGVVGLLLLSVSLACACEHQLGSAIGIFSDQGRRPTQEDRWLYESVEGGHLFGVFDGHNGFQIAQFAKEKLASYFRAASGSVEEKMKVAFSQLDNDPFIKTNEKCGSTASVVFVNKDTACFAHVGDSRALLEKNGIVDFATQDHKPNRIDEKNRIQRLGGTVSQVHGTWRVEYCLALSRAFGDSWMKQYIIADPEYTERQLTSENRYLILASDGLWNVMTNDQVVQRLKDDIRHPSARFLAWYLGTFAAKASNDNISQENRTKDNITIIVVDLLLLAIGRNK